MSRKLIAVVVITILVITLPVVLYFHFRPKPVENVTDEAYKNNLYIETTDYESFLVDCLNIEKIKSDLSVTKSLEDDMNQGKHLAFFTSEDADSGYVESALLVPLSLEGENPLPDIVKVTTDETKNLTVTQLKHNFGIENTPAFVYYTVEDEKIIVISTLSYYNDEPFSKDDLRTWLFENELWNGPYE